ncbi:hypothetical protein CPB97_000582 [Podila verticillata]|nr:hypothetical protein CPB97_000582 [Podila verticillata]
MTKSALYAHNNQPVPATDIPDPESLMVVCLAFVDDTTWSAPSQENLQEITNMASQFLQLTAIDINPAKPELLVIAPTHAGVDTADPVAHSGTFAGTVIPALPPAAAACMLGVWVSADGSSAHTCEIIHAEVSTICQMLSQKSVTDVQAVYIINNT